MTRNLVSNALILVLTATSVALIGLRPAAVVVVVLGIAAIAVNFTAPRPSPGAEVSALASDVRAVPADLRGVLAGIIADEGGRVIPFDGNLVALFRGRGHAASAVHAAQRMLSNADALQRRLERQMEITIGVESGAESDAPAAAAAVEKLTRECRVPVLIGAAAAAKLGSSTTPLAAIDEHERLFSFVPVQKRLPGF